jgi:prepilin-type processing-associated H-X9-DG protein
MNVKFDEGHDRAARARRWAAIRDLKQFHCPSNEVLSVQFGSNLINDAANGVIVTHGRMFSYCASMGFLLTDNTSGTTSSDVVGVSISRPEWNVPASYNAKMSKVGDPSKKVFIADGSKWSNATTAPDTDLDCFGQLGGPFADQGPTKFSRAWARDGVPNNGGVTNPQYDTRIFWARHGPASAKKGSKSGAFRFNVGFFDGHVETLDDLAGSDPKMYWPKGTSLNVTNSQLYTDQINAFFKGATSPVILP